MKSVFAFACVSLVFFANVAFATQTLPQIKFLGAQAHYSNPVYNDGVVIYANGHNKTYNDIYLYWNLLKDFSPDSRLVTEVYATDETFQNGVIVLKNATPICRPSKTRELLPKALVADKSLLGKSCIKKGIIKLKDMGQFRFEVLIPYLGKFGKYFKANYYLYQDGLLHFSVTYYNVLAE